MTYRTVIKDKAVAQDIEHAITSGSYRMVDDAICSFEWTLARKPDVGTLRSGRFWVYVQEGFKVHRIPEIVTLYSFTDDEVVMHAILFRPAP